jgi:hypothetical protein
MEEDEDGIATILLKGIPKTIPTITLNPQWGKDVKNNLPKQRYGVEIKINPAETPTEESIKAEYHHPRIFKAITTAIITASLGTTICSTNDDKDMLVDIDNIPTTEELIKYNLEAPTIKHKNLYLPC